MQAGFSFFYSIKQLLQGLMVILSGGLLGISLPDESATKQLPLDTFLSNQKSMSVIIVLETDGSVEDLDLKILHQRFANLHFEIKSLEQKNNQLIIQMTGPQMKRTSLERLTAPGKFVIATLELPDHWKDNISESLQQLPGVEWIPLIRGDEPSFAALDKETLQPLALELKKHNLLPFVYCHGDSSHNRACILHALKPGLHLSNKDVEAIFSYIEMSHGEKIIIHHLKFTSDAAKQFLILTKQNLKKPLPILLDEEVYSMPIVQDIIEGGEVQISVRPSYERVEESSIDELIFRALVLNPPLTNHWGLVHFELINTKAF